MAARPLPYWLIFRERLPMWLHAADGYPLGQKGRAGAALVITAIASFVGG